MDACGCSLCGCGDSQRHPDAGWLCLSCPGYLQADQDLGFKPCCPCQFQDFGKHELLAWFVDQVYCPGTFPKEVSQCLGIDGAMEQAPQSTEGLALIADDQGVHDLQQMSYLRLVKGKVQCKNERCQCFGMLYNQGEHWSPLAVGFGVTNKSYQIYQCSSQFWRNYSI
jgi:hypothetical protein